MKFGQSRQKNAKRRADIFCRLEPNQAVVTVDVTEHDRQPESMRLCVVFCRVKWFKDAVDLVGRNAAAGVGDGEQDAVGAKGGLQGEPPAPGHGVEGVLDEVDENLLDLRRVEAQGGERAGELFLESTLKKSVNQFRTYWKRLLFSGGGTVPKVFRSSTQIVDFVARQPGGIGVIEASVVDDRVRVVEISN